jgi:hypothetical protein
MRTAIQKVLLAVGALGIAYLVVYALVKLLGATRVGWLQQLAFWISPLAFTGWIFGILVAWQSYRLLVRWFKT